MNSLTVVFLLTSLLVSVYSKSVDPQPPSGADLVAALDFIRCTQKAIITGIPEADIPGHDPLLFKNNASFSFPLGISNVTVHLDNMRMDGIPYWNVTEAVQEPSNDSNVDVFKFTIYWPVMSFSADWEYDSESLLDEEENSGTLYIELDHVNFDIGWISTKPTSDNEGTLDDFSLGVSTKEAHVKVSNLGLTGDLINSVGGSVLEFLVNNNPAASETGTQLKEKLIRDWVEQPEKIDAINANCDK